MRARLFLIQVLLFLLAQPLWAISTKKPKLSQIQMYIDEGDRFAKEFDLQNALTQYEKAEQLSPMDFNIRWRILKMNNSLGQTMRDQNKDPKQVEFHFRRNVELAEKLYKDFPNKAETMFAVAVSYGNLALFSPPKEKVRLSGNIEALLKKAIETDPDFAYSYLGLGMFYREVSKITFWERFFAQLFFGSIPQATLADSEKYFRMAIEREPDFIFSHFYLAKALEDAEKYSDAVIEYRAVLQLPASDASDPFFKEVSTKALERLKNDYPAFFSANDIMLKK